MIRFTLRQVIVSIQLLLGVSILVFVLISIYPTDPVASLFGTHGGIGHSGLDPEETQSRFGGDTPGPVRYLFWMKEVVTGNLGVSSLTPTPVAEVIVPRIPVTLGLSLVALGVAALAGAAIGVFSAGSERSSLIRLLRALPIFFASVPTVFLALWGLYVFAVRLGWVPAFGLWTPGADAGFNLDLLHHAILPTVILALPCIAIYMRYARQSILHEQPEGPEQADAGHGSQGLLLRSRQEFRSTMAPLVRNLHLSLPAVMSSALVVETLLSLGGIGRLAYLSLLQRDYAVLTAAVLAIAVVVVLARLLIALIHGWLDPSARTASPDAIGTPGEPGPAGAGARTIGPPLELIDRPLANRPGHAARGRLLSQRPAATGFVILSLFVAMAVFAPVIAPFDPNKPFWQNLWADPSTTHWLGTDGSGRDVFSMLVHGARTSLWIGAMAVVISLVLGFAIGGTAGHLGGRIDTALMRVTNVVGIFPALFLVLFLVIPFSGWIGPGSGVALLIGIVSWPGFARLIRRQILVQRHAELSRGAAAEGDGGSDGGDPEPGSMAGPIAVAAAYGFAAALLVEATMSFLGFGAVFPSISWGQMVGQGRGLVTVTSPAAVAPAMLTVLAILSAHLVADGLRNVFDARREEPQAVESDDEPGTPDDEHGLPA